MGRVKYHQGDRRSTTKRGVRPGGKGGMIGTAKHVWSPSIANKIEIMAAQGVTQDVIAFANDISVETAHRHYREQLDKGRINANFRVMAAILQSATGERVECATCDGTGGTEEADCDKCNGTGEGREWRREPNTTAQIWFSKNSMGWTDKERIEHVGADGGPIQHEQHSSGDVIKDRLDAIRKRIADSSAGE